MQVRSVDTGLLCAPFALRSVLMSDDKIKPIPRQPDAQGRLIYFTGGVRAAKFNADTWLIEPVSHNGQPSRRGFFDQKNLNALMHSANLSPIAFHDIHWSGGRYQSIWVPLVPGRTNHMIGPSDLWSNLASNLARSRTSNELKRDYTGSHDDIAQIVDARSQVEWLARSISLSLRSLDICVEQIAEFYNEQLVNMIASGLTDGRKFGGIEDQRLFAFVHSFFLHFGAARDYLAAFIALRLGRDPSKIDAMNRLVDMLKPNDKSEALVSVLIHSGLVKLRDDTKKFDMCGWLKEGSKLRNRFVHKRPYGSQYNERFGHVSATASKSISLYRYNRPIDTDQRDILDLITYLYKSMTGLFHNLAEATGRDISILTITDADIVSSDIKKS